MSGNAAIKKCIALKRWMLCVCPIVFTCSVCAQNVFTLNKDSLRKNVELSFVFADWYFHPGDLPRPAVTTQGWDTLKCTAFGDRNFPKGWTGMGWFGLWVRADAKAINQKMCFRINHDGASEIFLDGRPIGGFGKVGFSAKEMEAIRMPRSLAPFWLNDTLPHLFAIRYSNFIGTYPNFYGFETFLGNYGQMAHLSQRNSVLRQFLLISAGGMFMLAILHFFLFLYYTSKKLNLYFSAFVGVLGTVPLCIFVYNETVSPTMQFAIDTISREFQVMLLWFGGLLLYAINYGTVPKWRKRLLAIICLAYMLRYLIAYFYYEESTFKDYYEWVFVLFFCDVFWVTVRSILKRQPGIWLIGGSMLTVFFLCLFTWIDIFHLWTSQQNSWRVFTLSAGELIFPICVSIYLALDFARTNKTLSEKAIAQEREKRELLSGQARRLEETVRERTAELRQQTEKLKEMDAVKSSFFTNITHEFKTPLTLIHNPAEQLLSSKDADVRYHAGLIKSNAERLLQLINQLLDLSKLENGLMEIRKSTFELTEMVKDLLQTCKPLATQKGIQLCFHSVTASLWLNADKDKLEKIFSNLLSNAIKFTQNGTVDILLEENPGTFTLTVKDTGIGIAASQLPYIFERFYQAAPSDARFTEGTGIGLALTKELTALLDGYITVESEKGKYTQFRVTLPLELAAPMTAGTGKQLPAPYEIRTNAPAYRDEIQDNHGNPDGKALVLLIEDNDALREFIGHSLNGLFQVTGVSTGVEGIRLAQEKIPDIVITDIMMPGMDGYEVCSALKSDEKTSHIPVIILTARTDDKSRIHGIETGADAYLGKPFIQQELLALMENLMKTRRLLQEKYNHTVISLADGLPSIEKQFLERIHFILNRHLDNAQFGADQLAREIGLSRTQLHRKLKGVLGKSPGDFIRTFRMEHAHGLLRQKAATVSEVAYMVGFATPAAFSTSFSHHFGFPPSEV